MVKPRPRALKDEQQRERPRLPRCTLNIWQRLVNRKLPKTLVVVAVEAEPTFQRFCIHPQPLARRHLGAAQLL